MEKIIIGKYLNKVCFLCCNFRLYGKITLYYTYLKKMWTLVLISDIQLLWSSASRNPILCLGFSFILFKIIFPLSHFSGKLQIFFIFLFENVGPPLFALSLFFRLKNWLKVSNQKSAYQSVIHSGLLFQIKI